MKDQKERDSKLVGLVQTMEDVYTFVEPSDSFQNKVQILSDTISRIFKQTVECAIFIREYTGHGFAGEPDQSSNHIINLEIFQAEL
jgi:hypothetical protein